ncbi:DUF2207 domain-containing protein [Nocardioides marmorisolisilvae]|uniref:DUF2207 domain-containing protein n=1 Tax=Nocardioides marmorisolisilvae TaxID=1542737 RepID=UPI00160B02F6|nr:DUF2207 domain-containing protein [Nocardioides marmorisolisilvae]
MKRLVATIFGLLVLAAVVACGAIDFSSGGDSNETARIDNYLADFTLKADGRLQVTEDLTVTFPEYRHGIFRFFDTRDPNVTKNRLIPTDIRVTRDGNPEPFQVLKESRGRYRNIKIGSAGVTFTGTHDYRISYVIEGAMTPGFHGAKSQFYWQLIPSGWLMPIAKSDLVVTLPADGENLKCAVGLGTGTPCSAEGSGTKKLEVKTGELAPHTPVTIKVDQDVPTPSTDSLPWADKYDPILGTHPVLLGIVLVASVLLGGAGTALSQSTKEKDPSFPLMYAPPDGIGPAQAAYLLTEKVERKAFVATMMYAAEKGAVKLDQADKSWSLTGTEDADAWNKVDGVTQLVGSQLNVVGAGQSFSASSKSVSAGLKLKNTLASFDANTKAWAKTSGLMITSGLGGAGCFVLIVLGAATIALGAWNPFNMSILALVPGLFAVGAVAVGFSGAGTKRTPAGRDVWSRVGGFKRILSTPSAQDRFDFSGRKDLYTAYLPWAVAFDCADEWAKKYRVETGEEPPAPSWLPVYYGAHTGNYVNQMVDSFDSTVNSAISSYEATQSSSSSGGGGGGFSGGGGGGGGGGGSW